MLGAGGLTSVRVALEGRESERVSADCSTAQRPRTHLGFGLNDAAFVGEAGHGGVWVVEVGGTTGRAARRAKESGSRRDACLLSLDDHHPPTPRPPWTQRQTSSRYGSTRTRRQSVVTVMDWLVRRLYRLDAKDDLPGARSRTRHRRQRGTDVGSTHPFRSYHTI